MSIIDEIERLALLHEQGLLTRAEFNDAKSSLISLTNSKELASKKASIDKSATLNSSTDRPHKEKASSPRSTQYSTNILGNPSAQDGPYIAGGIVIMICLGIVAVSSALQQGSQQSNSSVSNKSSTYNSSIKAKCAFQEVRGGSLINHQGCRVTSRVNANGHTVYDVYERDGYKRTVVLWKDSTAEVFASGKRFTGRWTDQGEQALVNINGGLFTFRFQ